MLTHNTSSNQAVSEIDVFMFRLLQNPHFCFLFPLRKIMIQPWLLLLIKLFIKRNSDAIIICYVSQYELNWLRYETSLLNCFTTIPIQIQKLYCIECFQNYFLNQICSECNSFYLGQSSRNFRIRLANHILEHISSQK